jgi:hypothetical protein
MSLIPQDELKELKSAADVKAVSDTAAYELEKIGVANLINSAANTGETCVVLNHKLSTELKEELESEGYTLKYNVAKSNREDEVCISWETTD